MLCKLNKKLRSKRGVSVVLALFLLLVCAFAGTAALTAAQANAGRHAVTKSQQQQYLSVSSAAKLIISELKKCNDPAYAISGTYSPTGTDNVTYGASGASEPSTDCFYNLIWPDVRTVMNNAVDVQTGDNHAWNSFAASTDSLSPREFTLTVDDESFEDYKVTVKCEFTKKDDGQGGDIAVKLSCGEYNYKFNVAYETEVKDITDSSAKCCFTVKTDATEILPGR